jgi:hypothetical protein
MFLPAILFIASLLLWWFASDADARWSIDEITTGIILVALIVKMWALIELFLLLDSDDVEETELE